MIALISMTTCGLNNKYENCGCIIPVRLFDLTDPVYIPCME